MLCLMLASGTIPTTSARAADAPPTITLSVKTIEGDPTTTTGTPSTSVARGGAVMVVGSTAALHSNPETSTSSGATTTQSKVYLELTIQNLDRDVATPQLEVRWHLYTKTTSVGKNSSNISMKDVSGSKTLPAIAPLAKAVVSSAPVDKNTSSSTSTAHHSVTTVAVQGNTIVGSSTSVVASETGSTSSVTLLDGYYVEVVYNGTVLRHSPTDDKARYEEFIKTQSGK